MYNCYRFAQLFRKNVKNDWFVKQLTCLWDMWCIYLVGKVAREWGLFRLYVDTVILKQTHEMSNGPIIGYIKRTILSSKLLI